MRHLNITMKKRDATNKNYYIDGGTDMRFYRMKQQAFMSAADISADTRMTRMILVT